VADVSLLVSLLLVDGPTRNQPPRSVTVDFYRPTRTHDGSADERNVHFDVATIAFATSLWKNESTEKSEYVMADMANLLCLNSIFPLAAGEVGVCQPATSVSVAREAS
jgi:hypothetical protein